VIVVRDAQPDEYERVGALTLAAYRALEVDHLWGGYDTGIAEVATRAKDADVLVALLDGELVGAVTYVADHTSAWSEWTHAGEAQFRLLAVDPRARGRGVGEALVRACLDRAERDGRRVVIHTTPWMPAARRMYERMGFVRQPDRDVPDTEWNARSIPGLPAEWVGQPFLAYTWIGGVAEPR
jgi:ribosomal protein S18 acetylase RimI-like enzyme